MVSMSKTSRKFHVPDGLAHAYDFANTLDLRRFVEHGVRHEMGDELRSPSDLAAWLTARGLLEPGARLTSAMLREALDLRVSLRDYLDCDPEQRHRRADIVGKLNDALAPFALATRVSIGKPMLSLHAVRRDALSGIGAIVAQLYDGAANGTLSRLKMCASEECRRVFYDRSKPGTRRWCQAALCGNRVKTRAYRERRRKEA
jgi:predicted RNA-binding Zn ribbon-like protein